MNARRRRLLIKRSGELLTERFRLWAKETEIKAALMECQWKFECCLCELEPHAVLSDHPDVPIGGKSFSRRQRKSLENAAATCGGYRTQIREIHQRLLRAIAAADQQLSSD
jgi:hypothetical protein